MRSAGAESYSTGQPIVTHCACVRRASPSVCGAGLYGASLVSDGRDHERAS